MHTRVGHSEARELLTRPEVVPAAAAALDWGGDADEAGVVTFLVGEKGFSEPRCRAGACAHTHADAHGHAHTHTGAHVFQQASPAPAGSDKGAAAGSDKGATRMLASAERGASLIDWAR